VGQYTVLEDNFCGMRAYQRDCSLQICLQITRDRRKLMLQSEKSTTAALAAMLRHYPTSYPT